MTPGRPERPADLMGGEGSFVPTLLLGDPVRPDGGPPREEEAKFEKIFNSSSMLLAFTEREGGRILDVNNAWIRAAGITREEALARTGSELGLWANPQDREAILAGLARAGRVQGYSCRLRMGGRTFPARIAVEPITMASGAHLLWEIQDLTEQEHLARLAARREDMFQQVFLNAPCAISLTRVEDGRILQVNRAWVALLGWSEEEADGRTLLDLGVYRNPEDRQALRRDMNTAGQVENWSFLGRRKDGMLLHLQVGLSRVRLEDAECFLAVLQDFSTLHEAEEAVRVSEARFRALLDASPIAIVVTRGADPLFANPRFFEVFGLAPGDVLGHSLLDRVAPACRPEILARMRRRAQGLPVPAETDLTALRRDGTGFPVHFMAAEIVFADGPATVIFLTDLSDRVRAEDQRAQFQAQFLQSQKMESLGVLAGGVAHDMNNVLGAILALASVHQLAQAPDSALGAALGTIAQAATRGGRLVRSLLNFARATPAEQKELDLNAILREEVHLLERTTLARVRLELDLAEGLRPVRGDASALTHAFMNLCVNSVDAMADQGTLTLRTRNAADGWVEVAVEDTGTGMPREVLDRAMEPFYTTKPVGKGTGLGLSLVYSTVKAHDGRMEILSEPGRGTCVRMSFPASRKEGPAADRGDGSPGQDPQAALTVLLVDDDELVLDSTRMVIEALGHTTVAAASGEEALAALAGCRPDLVILDLNMPGLGGRGALPALRALRPDLPILLATGRPDEEAEALAASQPGLALMAKPYDINELQRHLAAILARAEARPSPPSAPPG